MIQQKVGFTNKDFEEIHKMIMDNAEESDEVLQILKKDNEILKRKFTQKLYGGNTKGDRNGKNQFRERNFR